jgi:hypothetical protein
MANNVANDEVVYRYYRRLLKSTAGRKLFTTTQGHIGTGPRGMEMGDVVVLIAGLELPMIVRGTGEQGYIVVGASHIHRVMEGDVWPSDEGELREIVLVWHWRSILGRKIAKKKKSLHQGFELGVIVGENRKKFRVTGILLWNSFDFVCCFVVWKIVPPYGTKSFIITGWLVWKPIADLSLIVIHGEGKYDWHGE